jgi:hypothetical protein
MSDEITRIWSSEWRRGFNCEARQNLGRDDAGLYYTALEISPDHDELKWDGPHLTQEHAHLELDNKLDRWSTRMDLQTQVWEDAQIGAREVAGSHQHEKGEPSVERRHIPINGMFGRDPDGNLRGTVEVSGLPEVPHGELKFSCRLVATDDGRMRLVEDNRLIAVTRSRDGHPMFVHPGPGAEIKPDPGAQKARDGSRELLQRLDERPERLGPEPARHHRERSQGRGR